MSEEREALLRSARDFCRREVHPLDIDQQHRIPAPVLSGLRELGLFGVTLPADFGGAAMSALDATQLVALLAEHDRSVATTVGLHLGLGTRALVAYGSRAQQERWLPSLASGATVAAFATTEPGAGSDLSALQTTARPLEGRLTLDGTKLFVTNGALCSALTVTALTPGLGGAERGVSMLLFDPHRPGVSRQPEERKLGLRGSSTTAFVFDGCTLPMEAVVGEPGAGRRQLAHVLSWGRLLLSAGCVGTARAALKAALAHAHGRRQFHRALIRHEVVQRQLSRAWALTFAMHALVTRAAEHEHDDAALARLTTSAKVFCSEAAGEVADLALQLHGGSGYVEDTGLALLVRDARVTRIFEGANDVLLTHAGLGELLEPAATDAQLATRSTPTDWTSDARGELQVEPVRDDGLTRLGEVWRAVRERRDHLARENRVRALGRHAAQHALGRAVMWRDAANAAVSLARSEQERAAAQWLCAEAFSQATRDEHRDESMTTLTGALLEGQLP